MGLFQVSPPNGRLLRSLRGETGKVAGTWRRDDQAAWGTVLCTRGLRPPSTGARVADGTVPALNWLWLAALLGFCAATGGPSRLTIQLTGGGDSLTSVPGPFPLFSQAQSSHRAALCAPKRRSFASLVRERVPAMRVYCKRKCASASVETRNKVHTTPGGAIQIIASSWPIATGQPGIHAPTREIDLCR